MPRNVEIKARVGNLERAQAVVRKLGARRERVVRQVDRYYEIEGARRVKLRTFGDGRAELIHYERPETEAVRVSDYEVSRVRDEAAGRCLVPPGSPLVTVRKERHVWLLDNVRVHLDRVDDLGDFVELEAVIGGAHDEATCRRQVGEIMEALGIGAGECLRASYSDLLLERTKGEPR